MSQLHEQDFYAWTQQQVHLLKDAKLEELDVAALIEELESMGAREKRELASRLEVILMHLLKWQYQPSFQGRSWRLTLEEQRLKLQDHFQDNPSLNQQESLQLVLDKSYRRALVRAEKETGLSRRIFPVDCPYSLEQMLDMDFYPNEGKNEN